MTDKVLFSATPTQFPTDLHRLSQVEKAAPYFTFIAAEQGEHEEHTLLTSRSSGEGICPEKWTASPENWNRCSKNRNRAQGCLLSVGRYFHKINTDNGLVPSMPMDIFYLARSLRSSIAQAPHRPNWSIGGSYVQANRQYRAAAGDPGR